MIISFKHKGLECFYRKGTTAGIQAKHAKKLARILTALNTAKEISELDYPGWNLHILKGSLSEHWSIKVNGNWRVTFKFYSSHVEVVDYQDYH